MTKRPGALAAFLAATLAAGCTSAVQHEQSLASAKEREMTVGVVQKEIHTGLTQAEVAEALGSPNIVTRDASGRETWIYDKMATQASYSASDVYGTILLLGGGQATGAASNSQKTLTVLIKFDPEQRVESFTYHSSRF